MPENKSDTSTIKHEYIVAIYFLNIYAERHLNIISQLQSYSKITKIPLQRGRYRGAFVYV